MDYLLKTEPSTYSFADLQREKTTVWDGVSNPVALKNMRAMKPGERLVSGSATLREASTQYHCVTLPGHCCNRGCAKWSWSISPKVLLRARGKARTSGSLL